VVGVIVLSGGGTVFARFRVVVSRAGMITTTTTLPLHYLQRGLWPFILCTILQPLCIPVMTYRYLHRLFTNVLLCHHCTCRTIPVPNYLPLCACGAVERLWS